GARIYWTNWLVVVVMDDGLGFDAVTMILLDDRGAVARLTLLDHLTLANAIAVAVVAFTNRHTGADRANANANLIRQRGRRESANRRGNQQNLLHIVLL